MFEKFNRYFPEESKIDYAIGGVVLTILCCGLTYLAFRYANRPLTEAPSIYGDVIFVFLGASIAWIFLYLSSLKKKYDSGKKSYLLKKHVLSVYSPTMLVNHLREKDMLPHQYVLREKGEDPLSGILEEVRYFVTTQALEDHSIVFGYKNSNKLKTILSEITSLIYSENEVEDFEFLIKEKIDQLRVLVDEGCTNDSAALVHLALDGVLINPRSDDSKEALMFLLKSLKTEHINFHSSY